MIRRPRLSARLMTAAAVSALCAAPAFAETSATETSAEPDVITVSSTPLRLQSDEVVGSVTVLSEDRLVELLDGNIADTLDALPGVSSSYFGPASGRPVIRGLSEDRVAVLINGLTAMDASSASPDHAVAGEVLGARGVEVLRGPAAIAYGGNAIGGVVNILDGRVPTQRVEGPVDGFAYLGATSVDEGTQAAGRVAFGAGPFVFQLEALRREAENFDIPGFAGLPPIARPRKTTTITMTTIMMKTTTMIMTMIMRRTRRISARSRILSTPSKRCPAPCHWSRTGALSACR